jgi:hypothetical protein
MSNKSVIIKATVMDRDSKGESIYYKPSEKPVSLPVKLANELLKNGCAVLPDQDDQDDQDDLGSQKSNDGGG